MVTISILYAIMHIHLLTIIRVLTNKKSFYNKISKIFPILVAFLIFLVKYAFYTTIFDVWGTLGILYVIMCIHPKS